jgi:hypothetical protein
MTSATIDHRSLPRKKRTPSSRDQAIYLAYKTTGVSQAKLALDNHLSQRRISAILQRVERWRANLIPAAAGELDHHQSQRLERWLEQQRLQAVFDRAIRGFDTQQSELKTTRNGDRDGQKYHDETTRQVPQNVQLLKVAIRAAESLGKLNDKPAPAASQPKDAEQRFWQVHSLIRELRRDAGIPQDESLFSKDTNALTKALDNLIHQEHIPERRIVVPPVPPTRSASERPDDADLDSELEAETSTPDPETSNAGSNCSNRAPHADTLDTPPTATVTSSDRPTSDAAHEPSTPRSPAPKNPPPPEPQPSPAERRRRHEEKLQQLYEARRRGLPYLIEFDPEDGPIPPTYYHLDDFGYIPSPPPSPAEIHEQNEQYLAKLRAENEANNRRCSHSAGPV